ncbi:AI-2E family transporter [Catenulispora pinistramenti]|uniref:AI-2E family transporter n=1 Tax=Catenulispora pinistramenti TaxID=2705254 RepID=UPI001E479025|nr:AI-2E family transporter [Catenulispora pinistramenti]
MTAADQVPAESASASSASASRAAAKPALTRTPPFAIGLVGGFGVLGAYYLGRTLTNVVDIIVMITMALVLAAGLNPFVEMLTGRGFHRRWAVTIVALAVLALFAGFIVVIAKPLTDQTSSLIHNGVPDGLKKLQDNSTIQRLDKKYHLITKLQNWFSTADTTKTLAGGAFGFGKAVLTSVFKAFTILMLTLYFLGSLPSMTSGGLKLVPRSRRERAADLTDRVLNRVGGYVSGALVVSTCATLASWLAMSIMGVRFALPLALLVGLTDLIPIIGATFGAFLACAVILLLDSPVKALAALIFFVLYQQLENYLIYPRVMSRTVDLPPAVAVIAALAGYTILGVSGALLFIPLTAGLLVIVRQVVLPAQDRDPDAQPPGTPTSEPPASPGPEQRSGSGPAGDTPARPDPA